MRMYLVNNDGSLTIKDIPVVDGIPHTLAGYPMTRTDSTRELAGWPDNFCREWTTEVNTYLVPETKSHGSLMNYQSGDFIRPASEEEQTRSTGAAELDGGSGVILVDNVSCYVTDY